MTKSFILIEVDEDQKEATKEAIRKHPAVSGVYMVIDEAMKRVSSMT